MKLRYGFVSNSSSSSYVICVAKVIDEEKLNKFLEQYSLDAKIYTTQEIINYKGWNRPVMKCGDDLYFQCESFNGDTVSIKMDSNKDEKYVSIYYGQDIDEDEYGPVEPAVIEDGGIYSLSQEHGVIDIHTSEGLKLFK